MNLSIESKAKYACLYAGAVWGLFWIPLRELEDAGFHGLWITVVYFLIPALCLVPVTIWRWKYVKRGGFQLQLTAIISWCVIVIFYFNRVYRCCSCHIAFLLNTSLGDNIRAYLFR